MRYQKAGSGYVLCCTQKMDALKYTRCRHYTIYKDIEAATQITNNNTLIVSTL